MQALGRQIPRANLVAIAIFLALTIPFFCLTLVEPAILAPFGRLLSARSWKTLQWVCTIALYGMAIYGFTKGRRKPTASR